MTGTEGALIGTCSGLPESIGQEPRSTPGVPSAAVVGYLPSQEGLIKQLPYWDGVGPCLGEAIFGRCLAHSHV